MIWINKMRRLLMGAPYLTGTRVRRCRCCERYSVIVSLSRGDEFKLCVRCRANLRYEMLAEALRTKIGVRDGMCVIEMDPRSPLRSILEKMPVRYLRTYYSAEDRLGEMRTDGAICEDVTRLTLRDASADLMISSDVLEHVPDLRRAFEETCRVLKIGGAHIFTVPLRSHTRRRAALVNGNIEHYMEPEYHSDPLNPEGILAYWDIGRDLPEAMVVDGLSIEVLSPSEGYDERVVWVARRYK